MIDEIISYYGPSLTAAVVAQTANQTAALAQRLSSEHHGLADASARAIHDIPDVPAVANVDRLPRVEDLEELVADLRKVEPLKLRMPEVELDGANIAGFSRDMLLALEQFFPGLRAAVAEALRRGGAALWAPVGHHYNEGIDRGAVEAAHERAANAAADDVRDVMNAAAKSAHRFMPGTAHERIAIIRGRAAEAGIKAAEKAYTDNVDKEYALRLKIARAMLDVQSHVISGFAESIAQVLNHKYSTETRIRDALLSVTDGRINVALSNFALKAHIDRMITRAANEFTQLDIKTAESGEHQTPDWRTGRRTFDQYRETLATRAATLYNQLRANAGLSNTDSDVTDYETL